MTSSCFSEVFFQLIWHAESDLGSNSKGTKPREDLRWIAKEVEKEKIGKVESNWSAAASRSHQGAFKQAKGASCHRAPNAWEATRRKTVEARSWLMESRNESEAFRGLLSAHIISINTDSPAICTRQHRLLAVAGQLCQLLNASPKGSAPAPGNAFCKSDSLSSSSWSFTRNMGNNCPYYHSHNIGYDTCVKHKATCHDERK